MLSASIRPAKYFSTVYISVHVSLCWVFYCVFIFLLFSLFDYYSLNIIYAVVIISGHVITSPVSQAGTRFTYSGGDQRLPCPRWVVTYRDGSPAHRRSPTCTLL